MRRHSQSQPDAVTSIPRLTSTFHHLDRLVQRAQPREVSERRGVGGKSPLVFPQRNIRFTPARSGIQCWAASVPLCSTLGTKVLTRVQYVPVSPTRTSTCLSLVIPETVRGSPTNIARCGLWAIWCRWVGRVGRGTWVQPSSTALSMYSVHYVLGGGGGTDPLSVKKDERRQPV